MIPGNDIMADIQKGHRIVRRTENTKVYEEDVELAKVHAYLAMAASLFNISNLLWETNEKLEEVRVRLENIS